MDKELISFIETELSVPRGILKSWYDLAKLVGQTMKREDTASMVIRNDELRRITYCFSKSPKGTTEESTLLFAEAPDGRIFSTINDTRDEGNTPDEMCQILYYSLIAYIRFKQEGVNNVPRTDS